MQKSPECRIDYSCYSLADQRFDKNVWKKAEDEKKASGASLSHMPHTEETNACMSICCLISPSSESEPWALINTSSMLRLFSN